MKIVNLGEFRKLPEGTIFCKYQPCYFGELEIFGGIFGENDFVSSQLTGCVKSSGSDEMVNILLDVEKTGESFELDTEYYCRDGLYEKQQLFAVYDNSDILQLIETLKKGLL